MPLQFWKILIRRSIECLMTVMDLSQQPKSIKCTKFILIQINDRIRLWKVFEINYMSYFKP